MSKRVEKNSRGYKGINFFSEGDIKIMEILTRGEFNIYGFKNKDIRKHLPNKSSGQISIVLKRLSLHGLIRKARYCYKYYLTKLGKHVLLTAMKIRELIITPALNYRILNDEEQYSAIK